MGSKKFKGKATTCSLDKIDNINSLEGIAKYDKIIRSHARMLTGNNIDVADEIVQVFYISMSKYFTKYPDKIINGGFISMSLRNRLRNYYNALNKLDRGDKNNPATIKDEIDVSFFENEDIQSKIEDELLYDDMYSRFEDLEWYEKKVLLYSLEMSMADLARASDIGYQNLRYSLLKAKKKIGVVSLQDK